MSNAYFSFDFFGLSVGIFAFIITLSICYYLLYRWHLHHKFILHSILLSALGHFLGALYYYYFSITTGSDSHWYFINANPDQNGTGYFFAFFILGYLKKYLLGESFLGAFLISGAIGLIGSTYYLLTYKILLNKLSNRILFYRIDPNQLFLPALLLLCWPSYFFWSAGLIKDSFAFLSIGMFLSVIAQGKFTPSSMITFAISIFLGFIIRPYLFIIFAGSFLIYGLILSRWSLIYKLGLLIIILTSTILILPLLGAFGRMVNFSGHTLYSIGEFAIRQQEMMNIGSSIPIPTRHPFLVFLFTPYLFFANLFLPLGIGAKDFVGILSSIENGFLLFWSIFFIQNNKIWQIIQTKQKILKFFMIYFLFGMSCLSIMHSNLGIAMREKMMYVPAFLICIFLTFAYKRILILKNP